MVGCWLPSWMILAIYLSSPLISVTGVIALASHTMTWTDMCVTSCNILYLPLCNALIAEPLAVCKSQGSISNSIQWLDHLAMEIIEQVH